MAFQLNFSNQAIKDIEYHKKSGNKPFLKKLVKLLEELYVHPLKGTGKPEPLKHNLTGYWSRRINKEHRLIYKVINIDTVRVYSARGHYL